MFKFSLFSKKSSTDEISANDFEDLGSDDEEEPPPPPPPEYDDDNDEFSESNYDQSFDQDSFFGEDESVETGDLNLNDEPELIDDVISEVSYDEVFEGEDPRTVYEKKLRNWLGKAPHPKLVFVKKKKKKEDKFVRVQEDVPDKGDIVDKKYDWMYRKQKRLKKRKNRKETAKEMMDRIAKRAEIEEAENIKAAEEAAAARKQASLAALGIKLDKDGNPIKDDDEENTADILDEDNILHMDGWNTRPLDKRLNVLFKSICKPELKT